MSDRELLELAAKAAGFGDPEGNFCWNEPTYAGDRLHKHGGLWDYVGGSPIWNPLHDDGQALRLAVKLNMHICIDTYCERDTIEAMYFTGPKLNCNIVSEINNPDPMAAVRLAIVRAAAEIGKTI